MTIMKAMSKKMPVQLFWWGGQLKKIVNEYEGQKTER